MAKQVKCAGKCAKSMDKVDGHAAGWRPLCDACRDLSWWYDEYTHMRLDNGTIVRCVRTPNDNFGKDPYR